MGKDKIVFVVNPNAGSVKKYNIIDIIHSETPDNVYYEIIPWDRPEQKYEIRKRLVEGGYSKAIAVGGDGTVNSMGKALIETNIALGIVPVGSGNGLARHLGIPLEVKEAIRLIAHGREKQVDVCYVNDKPFFCTSGIGFDALIGVKFASSKRRGLLSYVSITIKELMRYKAGEYKLIFDGKEIRRKAFLITFANAAQYGNDAYIAPKADISDGLLDVCILKPFYFWQAPLIAIKLFNKTIDISASMETFKTASVRILRDNEGPVHYDGEPVIMGKELEYKLKRKALKVIVP